MNHQHILAGGLCLVAATSTAGNMRAEKPGAPGATPEAKEHDAPHARGERYPDKLAVGDLAPDFHLPDASGTKSVQLSSFRGKKPVVLIFGSYT